MEKRLIPVCCLLILTLWTDFCLPSADISNLDDDFDFDNLPGATHEFKVTIGAGERECFFQRIKKGGELYVSFEVLKGADRNVDCVVLKPNGDTLASELWTSDGSIERENIEEEGDYQICIDNSFSRFSSKLVYMYIVAYSSADWEAYSQDIEKLEVTVANFTNSISKVSTAVTKTLRFQALSRQNVIRDWYLMYSNNRYVNYYSIAQIIVVMCTSATQVYFLRRMFNTSKVTPTAKPRA